MRLKETFQMEPLLMFLVSSVVFSLVTLLFFFAAVFSCYAFVLQLSPPSSASFSLLYLFHLLFLSLISFLSDSVTFFSLSYVSKGVDSSTGGHICHKFFKVLSRFFCSPFFSFFCRLSVFHDKVD